MRLGLLGQAVGVFAVTNIDDIVLLAVFFGQAAGRYGRVVVGQYLGFVGILAVSVAGVLGARLLPDSALPYLGLLPLLLGLYTAWQAWRGGDGEMSAVGKAPTVVTVAAVTLANGGDNVGVYVPVFANGGTGQTVVYLVVFLVLVAVWCVAGRYLATRPAVTRAMTRWGHIVVPVVLIALGVGILVS
ncbi:cadmium resistance transporter [Actinocrispum wychmicini]|uniref:Cadmium resistance protein CadD (Predicted permease) n=1 Tax=Actinocrispum wychmicini TaxID=1213861 RepID=A0A4R2IK19_9PSEU|nr:cadmium resistance transporter [Actinocrispum wychmicini]TCO44179.1 cadmium resistance protein CadD (predicted permease) [Actinocrispum wychmicini]